MNQHPQIDTSGALDGLTWLIIGGAMLLAIATQALKALGIKPPLNGRDIVTRSLGAGLAALTLGLILLGMGKITVHWALFIGAGGLVGYWGQEALGFAVSILQTLISNKTGTPPPPPSSPSPPPGGGAS